VTKLDADTIVGRLLRYPLKLVPAGMTVPILRGPLRGRKWISGSHLHGCWLGSYEVELQQRISRELTPGSVFFDLGANVGFYTLLAALSTKPRLVCAFEPVPANLVYLRRHLELNHVRNVEVLEMAISDRVGTAEFEVEETRAMGRLSAGGHLRVATSTLDALIEGHTVPAPDFIKMDIEGGELAALRGATQCFLRIRPKLFLAVHGRQQHEACVELLASWKYHIEYLARRLEDRAEILAQPS
jgi:FkbM family methyltransferase